MGLKRALMLIGLALALALTVVGMGWSDLVIEGRDIVEADAGGGDLMAAGKGEGLLYGAQGRRYPFVSTAQTLRGISTSASDEGYLWIQGLNSSGDATTDSVLLAGTAEKTFSGTWLAVNRAEFHDDSTNVGEVKVYHGAGRGGATDSLLADIMPRQRKASMAQMTMPAGRTQLQLLSFEADPTTVFSGFPSPKVGGNLMGHLIDSTATGHVGLLARKPGQAWEELRGLNFRSTTGPVFLQMVTPETYDLPGLTQLEVAAAVTGAATDLYVRARVNVK